METERVTQFPHTNMDPRPRKRQCLGWDVATLRPTMVNWKRHHTTAYFIPYSYREDDKDGHYVFAVGDNLTSRYKIHSKMGEGTFGQVLECWYNEGKEIVAIKIVRGVEKYQAAAMIEVDVLQQLVKMTKGVTRFIKIFER